MNAQDNYPAGYSEHHPPHFPMPEVNEENNINTVHKSLPWHPRENGTQAGNDALEASLARTAEESKLSLYNEYATPDQSFEDFCTQIQETLGVNWINKLSRKSV